MARGRAQLHEQRDHLQFRSLSAYSKMSRNFLHNLGRSVDGGAGKFHRSEVVVEGGLAAMGELTIWTNDRVPEGPRGFMRDLRLRWACEEAGLSYEVQTIPFDGRETKMVDADMAGSRDQ